jgi:hypothetical protein
MFAMKGKVEGGALAFGDVKYKAVLLPAIEHMPLATARALEQFAKNGGHLVAMRTVPSKVPGYRVTQAEQEELTAIMSRLFRDAGAPGTLIEAEGTFADAMGAKFPPDLRLETPVPGVGHVHRHTDAGELYFVANTTNTRQALKATFRVPEGVPRNAEIWDPLTGKVRPLAMNAKTDKDATVALDLTPYGSAFVLFTGRALGELVPNATAETIPLTHGWSMTIGDKTMPVETLQSWTQLPGMQNYSGLAAYETKFQLNANQAHAPYALTFTTSAGPATAAGRGRGQGFAAQLDAPVREAAVVFINGKRAGAAWCPPYAVELTGLLKAGENTLRIEVANTAVNHIAGRGFPNYNLQAIRAQYGNRFDPQGVDQYAQPLPSGIIGAVRLEPAAP